MLTWTEREDAQKDAVGPVVKAPTAQAPCEATLGGRTEYRPVAALGKPTFSDPSPPDAKAFSNLVAQFALAGYELHVIRKGDRTYFEVRRWRQCYMCSTEADLHGVLRQIGGSYA